MATDPAGALASRQVATALKRTVTIAAMDVSEPLLAAIEGGGVAFTIDQQQYMQGYLSVVALYLKITGKTTNAAGAPVVSNPGFVDTSNVAAVKERFATAPR